MQKKKKTRNIIEKSELKKASKYNRFVAGDRVVSQSCTSCMRKHLRPPYRCFDSLHNVDGSKCTNWTNTNKCKVV